MEFSAADENNQSSRLSLVSNTPLSDGHRRQNGSGTDQDHEEDNREQAVNDMKTMSLFPVLKFLILRR
jgi:hypothetical protein